MKKFDLSQEVFQQIFIEHTLGVVNSVHELHGGYANPAFLINDKFVVRFNADENEDRKNCFLRESTLYSAFAKLNIPAPEAIAIDINKNKVPYYYIINTYIPGDILSSVYASFSEEEQREIAFKIGKLLKHIHSLQPQDIDDIYDVLDWQKPWKETIVKKFEKTYGEFNEHKNFLSVEDRKLVEQTFSQFKEQISENDIPVGLIHNDFHANHIVVQNKEIKGVIDFEWASFGDPLWDLQKLPIFTTDGTFSVKDFLRGYGLEKFNEKEMIRFKMSCIEQGIWMIDRTRHGNHGFPEEGIELGYELIKNVQSYSTRRVEF